MNQGFVDELIAQHTGSQTTKKSKKGGTDVEKLMTDPRFKVMFEDEEFKRDPKTEALKRQIQVSEVLMRKAPNRLIDCLTLLWCNRLTEMASRCKEPMTLTIATWSKCSSRRRRRVT